MGKRKGTPSGEMSRKPSEQTTSEEILSDTKHASELLHSLCYLQETGRFCDVTLLASVDEVRVPVHGVVIACCSPYFLSILYEENKSRTLDVRRSIDISLTECTVDAVQTLVRYIYTGRLVLSTATVQEIYTAFMMLQVASAISRCLKFAQKHKVKLLNNNSISKAKKDEELNVVLHDPDMNDENCCNGSDDKTEEACGVVKDEQPGEVSAVSSNATSSILVPIMETHDLMSTDVAAHVVAEIGLVTESSGGNLSALDVTESSGGNLSSLDVTESSGGNLSSLDVTESTLRSKRRKTETSSSDFEYVVTKTNSYNNSQSCAREMPFNSEVRRTRRLTRNIDQSTGDINTSANKLHICDKPEHDSLQSIIEEVDSDENLDEIDNDSSDQDASVDSEVINVTLKKRKTTCRKCWICKMEFSDYESYAVHKKQHTAEQVSQERAKSHTCLCDVCSLSFKSDVILACHRHSKHNIPFDESKFTLLKCKTCSYTTLIKYRLQLHIQQCQNDQRLFMCDVCGVTFKTRSAVTTHSRSHSEAPKMYECSECNKTFAYPSSRDQHIRRIHDQSQPFSCAVCAYKSFVNTEVLQHQYKEHNIPLDKKYVSYKCDQCSFETFRKFAYLNHLNAHSGNRQFICNICQKSYTSKAILRSHMLFHKEPQYKCTWTDCNYAAVQKKRLEQHVRLIHTHQNYKPFACLMCGYKTNVNGNLKLHLINVHHVKIQRRPIMNNKSDKKTHYGIPESQFLADERPVRVVCLDESQSIGSISDDVTGSESFSEVAAATTSLQTLAIVAMKETNTPTKNTQTSRPRITSKNALTKPALDLYTSTQICSQILSVGEAGSNEPGVVVLEEYVTDAPLATYSYIQDDHDITSDVISDQEVTTAPQFLTTPGGEAFNTTPPQFITFQNPLIDSPSLPLQYYTIVQQDDIPNTDIRRIMSDGSSAVHKEGVAVKTFSMINEQSYIGFKFPVVDSTELVKISSPGRMSATSSDCVM